MSRPSRPDLVACALAACLVASIAASPRAAAEDGPVAVDVEIVLAVDVSYSMNDDEQHLQRTGYVEAITSPEFLQALKANNLGKVAVAYVEWASYRDQKTVVGWTLIDGADSARAFADRLAQAPLRRARHTSISGAIDASMRLFDGNGYNGDRRVIDISGDGPNNDGRGVVAARDEAVAKGVTINGLPLVGIRPYSGFADIEHLDQYYEDCVIGGLGAFMVPISDTRKFTEATRTKLVQEISRRSLSPPATLVVPASAQAPRVSCTIGETMWERRFHN